MSLFDVNLIEYTIVFLQLFTYIIVALIFKKLKNNEEVQKMTIPLLTKKKEKEIILYPGKNIILEYDNDMKIYVITLSEEQVKALITDYIEYKKSRLRVGI